MFLLGCMVLIFIFICKFLKKIYKRLVSGSFRSIWFRIWFVVFVCCGLLFVRWDVLLFGVWVDGGFFWLVYCLFYL